MQTDVSVYWRLLARDFEDSGKLLIRVSPLYYKVEITHEVDTVEEEKQDISYSLIRRPGTRNILYGDI